MPIGKSGGLMMEYQVKVNKICSYVPNYYIFYNYCDFTQNLVTNWISSDNIGYYLESLLTSLEIT